MKKILILACFIIISPLIWSEVLYFTGWMDKASIPNNNAPIHFYVVNLDRQPDRFKKFKEQSDKYGVEIERISATDGYKIIFVEHETQNTFTGIDIKSGTKSFEPKHSYDIYCTSESYNNKESPEFIYNAFEKLPRALTIGEIGLDCSYRLLWKSIATADQDQIAIIFEDDAMLLDSFDQNIATFINSLPNKWDIAYLDAAIFPLKRHFPYNIRWYLHFPTIRTNHYFTKIHHETNIEGTYAYAINKESAQKLINSHNQDTSVPIDYAIARAIQKRVITAYLAQDKIVSHDYSIESEISNMGRKKYGN